MDMQRLDYNIDSVALISHASNCHSPKENIL